LEEFQATRLPRPPYSPSISPCDIWFFGWSRDLMQGQKLHGPDLVRVLLLDSWQNLDPSMFISIYRDAIKRLESAIATNGDDNSK
jgi:hypothetical protein